MHLLSESGLRWDAVDLDSLLAIDLSEFWIEIDTLSRICSVDLCMEIIRWYASSPVVGLAISASWFLIALNCGVSIWSAMGGIASECGGDPDAAKGLNGAG